MCICDLSACIYTWGTSAYSLTRRTGVEFAQVFDSGEILGRAQNPELIHDGHQSVRSLWSFMFSFFRANALAVPTDWSVDSNSSVDNQYIVSLSVSSLHEC